MADGRAQMDREVASAAGARNVVRAEPVGLDQLHVRSRVTTGVGCEVAMDQRAIV